MILSRVRLDLNGLPRQTLFDVMNASAYSAHQLLWRLFADHDSTRPFLFRQEIEAGDASQGSVAKGLPLFYVLSTHEPVVDTTLFDVQSKTFEPSLAEGDRLAFRLRANPTIARRVEASKRAVRSDVLMHAKSDFPKDQRATPECAQAMDEAATEWLAARAERHGFALPVQPIIGAYRQHVVQKKSQPKPVQFSSLDYEGQLEVTDPTLFIQSLASGIGRAKAFGCGLMLVRPASDN
jgi:CRISPR system Cascade subunit CasE